MLYLGHQRMKGKKREERKIKGKRKWEIFIFLKYFSISWMMWPSCKKDEEREREKERKREIKREPFLFCFCFFWRHTHTQCSYCVIRCISPHVLCWWVAVGCRWAEDRSSSPQRRRPPVGWPWATQGRRAPRPSWQWPCHRADYARCPCAG